MQLPKYKAFIKSLKWLVPVERINFDLEDVEVDLTDGQGDTAEYSFDEVILLPYIGLKASKEKEVYLGDILLTPDKETVEVQWHEEKATFLLFNHKTQELQSISSHALSEYQHIGNIHTKQ